MFFASQPVLFRVVYHSPIHEGSYFTYIMASRSRTLYIGVTGNLYNRVFEHKWKERDGFTARYNCDRLVWFEAFQYVQKAIAREKELKGWRRDKKIALIESTNAAWMDLSRECYDCEPADYRRALDRMDAACGLLVGFPRQPAANSFRQKNLRLSLSMAIICSEIVALYH